MLADNSSKGKEKGNRVETMFSIEMAGSTMRCDDDTIDHPLNMKLTSRSYHGCAAGPLDTRALVKRSGKLNLKMQQVAKTCLPPSKEECMELPYISCGYPDLAMFSLRRLFL